MPSGRFAPSPTGRLHLGNLRTALVAWLLARHDGSSFHLRFDDLDHTAVRPDHYRTQLDDLAAIGIDWDEPVVLQSERRGHYDRYLDELVQAGLVYPCYCSRREIREAAQAPNAPLAGHQYPGTCRSLPGPELRGRERSGRSAALRFRTTDVDVGFDDLLAGPVRYAVDDFVIRRNDGTPAYHLVTVVDDADLGIELVVRADDLLDSTSRQLTVARALGLDPPRHAHVPLVLGPEGDRLAKRHGDVTLADRAGRGEPPAAVVGRLAASLGLVPEPEPLTASELLADFDPAVLRSGLARRPLVLDESYLS